MSSASPLVFVLPALGVAAAYYGTLAQQLRDALGAEVDVVAPPGPGNWRQRLRGAVAVGYPELVAQLCDRVMTQRAAHAKRPVLLLGHSLGGHVALLAAAQLGAAVQGVALVACGTPHWGAWPKAEQARLRRLIGVVDAVSRVLPWYPGELMRFGGSQPRRLMRHWSAFARSGSLARIPGFENREADWARLELPVLSVGIEGDTLAPRSATDHLLAAFARVRREHVTLSNPQLLALPPARRHFAWCRRPQDVVASIGDWLGKLNLRTPSIDASRSPGCG